MTRRAKLLTIAAVGTALWLGFWDVAPSRDGAAAQGSTAAAAAAETETHELREQLDEMRAGMHALRGELRATQQRAGAAEPATAAPSLAPEGAAEPPPPLSMHERERVVQEKVTQRHALLADTMRAETPDPTWGDQMRDAVDALLDADRLGSSELLEMSCAATICRLRLRHSAVADFDRVPQVLGELEHQNLFVRGEPHEDGAPMYTTVHFSRRGYALPK